MLSAKRERFKDAFKIGAYRFVTKPIDILKLEEAINDAEKTYEGSITKLMGFRIPHIINSAHINEF